MSKRGNAPGEDRFRVRPGKPKQRGDTFIAQVLRQAGKASNATGGKRGKAPGSRLGRGHTAARFTGQSLSPLSRRATVKVRLVYLHQASGRSTVAHLRYIEREGVDRQGGPGHAYGPLTDEADTHAFEERGREDRHQFRFIVSPEDAEQLEDLRTYTRHLMQRMEADLGTRLDWVAVDHWNTDNPTPTSCCAARTTPAKTSSFPATTSARACVTAPANWPPNGSVHAPNWRFSTACSAKSIRSDGRA